MCAKLAQQPFETDGKNFLLQETISVYLLHFTMIFYHPPQYFHPGTIVAHTVSEGHIARF